MRNRRWMATAVAAAMLQCGGCAWQAQAVKISPDVQTTSVLSGNGKSISLSIADERPSKTIGQRGVSGVGADMTVDGDLENIVREAIVSGLAKHNFLLAANANEVAAKLRVEIRNLSTKNIMGFWAGTLRDEFSLKAICTANSGVDYQKMYNGLYETSIQVVPTGKANDDYVSRAVSDGISQLVNDEALLKCLADGGTSAGSATP